MYFANAMYPIRFINTGHFFPSCIHVIYYILYPISLLKFFKFIHNFFLNTYPYNRAGLPSIMGAFPQYFTEKMIKDQGRWLSDSVKAYKKLNSIGFKAVHKKIVSLLLENRFKFYAS